MKNIKRVNTQLSSDSSIKTTVITLSKYDKDQVYHNDAEQIDLIGFDGSLYYYSGHGTRKFGVDDPRTVGDFECLVRKGTPGEQGPKGDNGDTPETPEIRARFDGGKVHIYSYQNGTEYRETTSPDLTGPSWKPKVEDNVLSWERSWDKTTPKSINLDELRPKEGHPVLFRVDSDNTKRSDEMSGPARFIQWKYEGQENWTNLISISELMNLTLAGVSIWYNSEDGMYHFGHREVISAKYDANKEGRRIITDVELDMSDCGILYDAGPIPFPNFELDIEEIKLRLKDAEDEIARLRRDMPSLDGYIKGPLKTINNIPVIGEGNIQFVTINGRSLIGNGDITIPSTEGFLKANDLKTIAGESLVGAGDIKLKTVNNESLIGEGNIAFPDLSEYAKKSEIPDVQDLSDYVKRSDIHLINNQNILDGDVTINVPAGGTQTKLRVSNNILSVSYDDGANWENLGTFGGDGQLPSDIVVDVKVENGKLLVKKDGDSDYTEYNLPSGEGGSACEECFTTDQILEMINVALNGYATESWVERLIQNIGSDVNLEDIKLKIENSSLYISYDNGVTWNLVGFVGGSGGGSDEDINALIANLREELERTIANLREELEQLSSTALEEAKIDLEQQINDAKTRLTNAETLLETVNGKFGTYDEQISSIQGTLEEHLGYINSVEGSITDLTRKYDAQEGTITNLASRVDTVEQSVTDVATELDATNATLTNYVKYTDFDEDAEKDVIANYVESKIDGKLATYTISAETEQRIADNVETTVATTIWDGLDGKVSTLITSQDDTDTKIAFQELATDRAETAIANSRTLAGIQATIDDHSAKIINMVEFKNGEFVNQAGTILKLEEQSDGSSSSTYYIGADKILLDGQTLINYLEANYAKIGELVVDYLKTAGVDANNPSYIEIENGHMLIYDGCGNLRVDFGVESGSSKTSAPVLKFYGYPDSVTIVPGQCPDMTGKEMELLYDLGPEGINWNTTGTIVSAEFEEGYDVMKIAEKDVTDLSTIRVHLSQPMSTVYKFTAASLSNGSIKYYDLDSDSWVTTLSINNKYFTSDGLALAKPPRCNKYIKAWPTGNTADGYYISFDGDIWYEEPKASTSGELVPSVNGMSLLSSGASSSEIIDDGIDNGYINIPDYNPDQGDDEVLPNVDPIPVVLYKFDNGIGTTYGNKYLKAEHQSAQYGYVYYLSDQQ